jgi:hypothetical protein
MEQEVKVRIIQMSKNSMRPASILKVLRSEFPSIDIRKLSEWLDDLIES